MAGQEDTPFFEVKARHRNGANMDLEIRADMRMRDGVMVGRQGIARDINEIKALKAIEGDCSAHTVKDSVEKIMQKLGAKRRAEAVACALKLGLLTADS